jgi:hypothetical protein
MKTLHTLLIASCVSLHAETNYYDPTPFGDADNKAKDSDNLAIGEWWKPAKSKEEAKGRQWIQEQPRDKAMAFALYTHDHGVLKITGQTFPLMPDEPKTVTLEFKKAGKWEKADEQAIEYPGWDVHFRVENWDNSKDIPFRLKLGCLSTFEGLIRKDPAHKDTIVVANMSCNSPRDPELATRAALVANLKKHDPDLLFFGGDQNYTHDEGTYGWLQWGVQFADIIKDRPTICIPDDHDVGHGNIWGENGKVSTAPGAADGGYQYPAKFVNMVQRQQTWNLPDPFDANPILQGISVYYTDLNVGGVSFAILEDRKFKSAPLGNIPKMGPRPDHINDPAYDRKAVDKPGLELLGDRQLKFLDHWARDWSGAEMKAALSQTAFCGAVHLHGNPNNRLLADLDCNGWPQTGRNEALSLLRSAHATHLCGDQHLAVVVQHGIEGFRDGPYAFTCPALVNTIYGRWWHPFDEKPGGGEKIQSVLPWTGDYEDGLGNKITMMAYANPEDRTDPLKRADGYGIARFHKKTGQCTFECWPRFSDVSKGDCQQFEGWPITIDMAQNDSRKPTGHLKEVELPAANAVVELTETQSGQLVYCYRATGKTFRAPVFADGKYTLKAGTDKADKVLLKNVAPIK